MVIRKRRNCPKFTNLITNSVQAWHEREYWRDPATEIVSTQWATICHGTALSPLKYVKPPTECKATAHWRLRAEQESRESFLPSGVLGGLHLSRAKACCRLWWDSQFPPPCCLCQLCCRSLLTDGQGHRGKEHFKVGKLFFGGWQLHPRSDFSTKHCFEPHIHMWFIELWGLGLQHSKWGLGKTQFSP